MMKLLPDQSGLREREIFDYRVWLTPLLLMTMLVGISSFNYLLFHVLIELFAVVVSLLMFVVSYQTRRFSHEHFLVCLGNGFFWIAMLDLAHLLAFKGMGVFSVDDANYATQIWILTRYLEVLLFLLAPFLVMAKTSSAVQFWSFGSLALAGGWAIVYGYFPDAYIEGQGLTPFKINSEYVICVLLVIAMLGMVHFRQILKPNLLPFLLAALLMTVVSELAFTFYEDVTGMFNLLGHVFGALAVWLIYHSIVQVNLHAPYLALEQSEQSLAESERRFSSIFAKAPIGLAQMSTDGVLLRVNQTLCEMLGYREEELLHRPMHDLTYPDDLDKDLQQVGMMVAGELERYSLEKRYLRKDGSFVWGHLTSSVVLDEQGRPLYLIKAIKDISAQKAADARLRILSSAIEESKEAIVITDAEGVIEYINPAFTQLTGYQESEAIGQNPRILQSGTYDTAFYSAMWATLLSGQPWQGRMMNRKKDGSLYPAMLGINPLLDDKGDITNFVGVQQSLVEYESLEEQFRQSQKMEAIGTLVGGIAHDFNNTLAGITGNVYLAKNEAATLPVVVERLKTIETLSFRAADMIRQLLTFSRKGVLEKAPVSIASFVKEAVKLFHISIPESIALKQEVNDTDMVVDADINLLQQVLMNLVNNARDAVSGVESPEITISLAQVDVDASFRSRNPAISSDSMACLSVRDNGTGMSAETLKHVFEPFFTTKSEDQGTGLGLAMVYGAVESHGGVIEVESTLQKGSVFRIYLPLVSVDKEVSASAPDAVVIQGQGELLMLVDDNSDLLSSTSAVLRSLNYDVLAISDSEEALRVYREKRHQIALVILDLVMPKLTGVELFRTIRELEPQAKALFTTGYDMKRDMEAAHIPTEDLLRKPFSVADLSRIVREKLDA